MVLHTSSDSLLLESHQVIGVRDRTDLLDHPVNLPTSAGLLSVFSILSSLVLSVPEDWASTD